MTPKIELYLCILSWLFNTKCVPCYWYFLSYKHGVLKETLILFLLHNIINSILFNLIHIFSFADYHVLILKSIHNKSSIHFMNMYCTDHKCAHISFTFINWYFSFYLSFNVQTSYYSKSVKSIIISWFK